MKKSKLIVSIFSLLLAITCLSVGVYCALTYSFSANGYVHFDSNNCKVMVNGSVQNAYSSNFQPLQDVTVVGSPNDPYGISYTGNTVAVGYNQLPNWQIGEMYFNEKSQTIQPIIITLSVTNYSTTNDVSFEISHLFEMAENLDVKCYQSSVADSNLLTGPTYSQTISKLTMAPQTKTFVITIIPQNTQNPASSFAGGVTKLFDVKLTNV